MFLHWQNMNENPFGKKGLFIFNFRFWIGSICIQWVMSKWESLGIRIGKGGEDKFYFSINFFFFSMYFNCQGFSSERREFYFYFYEWTLFCSIWSRVGEWNRDDPWWIKGGAIDIRAFIFGHNDIVKDTVLKKQDVLIPLPEGCYKAEFELRELIYKRPRWFSFSIVRCVLKSPGEFQSWARAKIVGIVEKQVGLTLAQYAMIRMKLLESSSHQYYAIGIDTGTLAALSQ